MVYIRYLWMANCSSLESESMGGTSKMYGAPLQVEGQTKSAASAAQTEARSDSLYANFQLLPFRPNPLVQRSAI